MKYHLRTFPYLILILSIILSSFLWDKISIPYENIDIIGNYSKNEHHSLNDVLRYIFFIFFPVILWLIFFFFFYKKKNLSKFIFNFKNLETPKKINSNIIYILFFFILFLFFEFLSLSFSTQKLDLIHEGQQLSSAYRNYLDNSLWSKSYVIVGIYFETINAKLFWNFFDKISIGSFRFSIYFYIFILKFLLIFLVYKVTNITNLNENLKIIFFIVNSFLIVNFLDYETSTTNHITFRDIPVIAALILIVDYFNNNKNKTIVIIILSSLSLLSLMWSFDRGIVYNLILISLLFYLILKKDYLNFIISMIIVFLTWVIFYIFLKNEFLYFVDNSKNIISQINYIAGIIHPTPFSKEPHAGRATKTLILIIINIVISIKIFFNSNKKLSNNFKFVLLFISLTSFLSYIYALGRSDGPHIQQTFGYTIIFQLFFLTNLILVYFNEKFFKKIIYFKFIFLIIFSSLSIVFFNYDIKNILTFKKRLDYYVDLEDFKFLNQSEIDLIKGSLVFFQNEKCIQLYSNNVALLYLLRKKSCSKFYFIWGIGSTKDQKILISELDENEYIIKGGQSYNWDLPINKKLPIYDKFVSENYELVFEVDNYKVLKKLRVN